VAQDKGDLVPAEQWYRKSLAVWEKLGDDHLAARTYNQLGIVAQLQGDFAAAEQWYRKSLAVKERRGDEHGAASTYGQLGMLSGLQGNYLECGGYLIKCLLLFIKTQDPDGAARNTENFMICYKRAPSDEQKKMEAMWKEAGLGDLPKSPE